LVLAEQLQLKGQVQFFNRLHQPVAGMVIVDQVVQAAEEED
tara:strand:+ start:169 stop:291 length:123 start_codon:yes stop_codon:yes gene_type:complete